MIAMSRVLAVLVALMLILISSSSFVAARWPAGVVGHLQSQRSAP
jgi:hypothetical protein